MALYGSHPIFIPQNAEAVIGREAVQASYQHIFQTIKLNIVFTIHEIVEMGDLAYGRTTSAGQTEVLAAHTTSKEANNELFIFRKENEQWRFTGISLLTLTHPQPTDAFISRQSHRRPRRRARSAPRCTMLAQTGMN